MNARNFQQTLRQNATLIALHPAKQAAMADGHAAVQQTDADTTAPLAP